MPPSKLWNHDKRFDIYWQGTENDGAAVLQGDDNKWYATILVPNGKDFFIGPFANSLTARKEAESARANPSLAHAIAGRFGVPN